MKRTIARWLRRWADRLEGRPVLRVFTNHVPNTDQWIEERGRAHDTRGPGFRDVGRLP